MRSTRTHVEIWFFLVQRKICLWILANGRPMASVTKVCPKPPSRHTGWTRPCMGEVWPLRPSSGLTFCALGAAWVSDAGTGVNVDGFIKNTEYLGGPFGPALCPKAQRRRIFSWSQVAKVARQHFRLILLAQHTTQSHRKSQVGSPT